MGWQSPSGNNKCNAPECLKDLLHQQHGPGTCLKAQGLTCYELATQILKFPQGDDSKMR